MSKAAKKILVIVFVLLCVVMAYAGITTKEKLDLQQQNVGLQSELTDSEGRVKKGISEIKNLKGQVDKANKQVSKTKSELKMVRKDLKGSKKKADDLADRIKDAEKDRDKYKKRIDNVKKERDGLMSKVQDLVKEKKSVERKLAQAKKQVSSKPAGEKKNSRSSAVKRAPARTTSSSRMPTSSVDEAYWAQLLKDKATLEIKIRGLEEEIADNALEIVDLAQGKTELQIDLDSLQHEHEALQRDMAHKEGLVNNLSLELARAKNDKKFISDRSKVLGAENSELRGQLKMLASTKGALEKSIVRLTKDKQKIEGELGKTETIIQSKIDEIWEIKDSIDQTIKTSHKTPGSSDVELPPIVISSDGSSQSFNTGMTHPGLNGKVVSINEENNFLIVNVGQNSGVSVGDKLSVYRDAKYLAGVEGIQVRNDIAAADIKDQWTRIEVGDLVQ